MTPTLYRYRIRTLGGEKAEVNATSATEALSILGLTPDQVRPWYPFALAVVPDPEQQAELDRIRHEAGKRLAALAKQRRESKKAIDRETTDELNLF